MTEVSIRPFVMSDAADLARTLNNKEVLDKLRDGLPFPYTESDAEDFIRSTLAADPDVNFHFAVVCGGKLIGNAGVFRRENVHRRTGELGYYIAEPYWGRGIMAQAVRLVCAEVFAKTDILRIFATPFGFNHASCRVLEKVGFAREGVLRRDAVKNGKVVDVVMYALLNEEVK